jgi:hypothetical protein
MGIRIHHPPSAVNDLPQPNHYCDCQCPGCNDHSPDGTPALSSEDVETAAYGYCSAPGRVAEYERDAFKAGAEWAITKLTASDADW